MDQEKPGQVALEQGLLRTAAPKPRYGGHGLGRWGWPRSRGEGGSTQQSIEGWESGQ